MKKRLANISAAVLASLPLTAAAAAGGNLTDGRPDQAPWRLARVAPKTSVAH